ncbi:MAG TPA: class I SAM-dependent methyltransferase [Nocardioidaceae bacterium]|jgi:SAM-dependent methyltransferase|nr:class I SAM-dependent methyltransferase [Nocardioidaceae bacterium]
MSVLESELQSQTQAGQATAGAVDVARVEEFAQKVAGDHAVAVNAVLAYLGDRLGLWKALASVPSATSRELSDRSGLAERYVREWLAAETAAGYVEYDPGSFRFRLPAEHAAVLADDSSPAALAGTFELTAGLWASVDRLAHVYATGEGFGWHEHDSRMFSGVDRFFRPLYNSSLVEQWLPAVDGLVARLDRGIRVLDVGCGLGSATLRMAEAFPASTFTGVDYHDESIVRASTTAARAGVQNRARFERAAADDYTGGPYDLICFFDALHDMGDPVAALRHARAELADGGVVLAVEPFANDRLEDNLNPVGLSYYAASATICVPNSLSQSGQAALGAQAGAGRIIEVFREAGFGVARQAAATPFNLVIEGRVS